MAFHVKRRSNRRASEGAPKRRWLWWTIVLAWVSLAALLPLSPRVASEPVPADVPLSVSHQADGSSDSSVVTLSPAMASRDKTLGFAERVRYQRRIEEVYWNHRIWPAANPGTKPALNEVLPDEVIRQRVADSLAKSEALERYWGRPLTGEQLQAEMDRMVRNTKNPEMLRELFAVLDDDPFLIAECLIRPVLVDRLAREVYAWDERFHGQLRRRAQEALAAYPDDAVWMPFLGGEYLETELRLVEEGAEAAARELNSAERTIVELQDAEWHDRLGSLAAAFGIDRQSVENDDRVAWIDTLPLNRISALAEEGHRFVVTAVLSAEENLVRTATVVWNKQQFNEWWAEVGTNAVEMSGGPDEVPAPPPPGGYTAMPAPSVGCTEDSWATTSPGPELYHHLAVWTGTEMIVWGSLGTNLGYLYDPATDSWTPTSTGADTPSARISHTAVWTGEEMIVWGGWAGDPVNTGGRYNPTTDSWLLTSMAGVPSVRQRHTAVWTGSEMIVWGGDQEVYHSEINTGGLYYPDTDSWGTTSTGTDTPLARFDHTAVWTGTKMIVWGGYDGSGSLNTGGLYDPDTGSWNATSTGADTPAARNQHTAVWAGTEMIVWGGRQVAFANTGGRYDPARNSWKATSTGADTPAARNQHTAVWTGAEMIVWGGYDGSNLNTGGLYNPAIDSWNATSTGADTPTASWRHTAVWTGAEMIVWGGGDVPNLNTGGLYCACGGEAVSTWYADADGDDYGTAAISVLSCSQPPGYGANAGDCNEGNANCNTDCTDGDGDGYCVTHDCDDTIQGCTANCTDGDANGIPDCEEEVVLTIYFMGTSMDHSMWTNVPSKFGRAETVATLYHFDTAEDLSGDDIYPPGTKRFKAYVYGPSTLDPDWHGRNVDAWGYLNETLEYCEGACITLNSVGFSRGGLSALYFANIVTDPLGVPDRLKKVNVLAFDPVPGDVNPLLPQLDGTYLNMSDDVEYLGFYAEDERSLGYSSLFPALPQAPPSDRPINFFKVRGAHETLVGSTYVNGHDDNDGRNDVGLRPVSRTLRMAATEMLGSSDWGHVRFDAPTIEEELLGALNPNWYAGETDLDQLRQMFVDELESAVAYGNWGYLNMREHTSVYTPVGTYEAWWYQGGEWDCNTAFWPWTGDVRNEPRCVYYESVEYDEGPLNSDGNWSIDWVDEAKPLNKINDDVVYGYVVWDLIAEHGSLDVDGDLVDYADDNCPITANPNQTDTDGDAVGDLCDNCVGDSNPLQIDTDGNGIGDACQADDDADGIDDDDDNCRVVVNADQADADADGVGDLCDNCMITPNAGQEDADTDEVGDVCDNCPEVWNPDQIDADSDGWGYAPGCDCDDQDPNNWISCTTCVDGDGDLDLVAGNYSSHPNRLYLNNGTANPWPAGSGVNVTADAHWTRSVALGDVDGDGDLDLVAGNDGPSGAPNRLYLNNGTANPWNGVSNREVTSDAHWTYSVALGDVDGDGDMDLVAGNYSSHPNRLYLNQCSDPSLCDGTVNPWAGVSGVDVTSDAHWTRSVALGDVDGDGDLDLLAGNDGPSGAPNRLYLNNGTAEPWNGVSNMEVTSDAHWTYSIALGDVDGDGDLDLVAGNYNDHPSRLYLNQCSDSGLCDGTTDNPWAGIQGVDISAEMEDFTSSVVLGDVDNDGDLDLVEGNYNGQRNRLYLNNGTTDPWKNVDGDDISVDTDDTYSVALGDVDGDGDLDLVAGNDAPAGATNQLYLNNGTGIFGGGSNITSDAHWTYSVALGDVDGDGDGAYTGCDAYVTIPGPDCDVANPGASSPGAPEINDGHDNQCPGETGYGSADEIEGICGFHNPGDKNEFSWTAQGGATSYEVARCADPHFFSGCTTQMTLEPYWSDGEPVAQGTCHHYLVRALTPNVGSWGSGSSGERTGICPGE